MPTARDADAGTGRWGVVVPVKRLSLAKSRLAEHGDELRRELALAFAADVVAAALGCPSVREVLVVTDDPDAERLLAELGARVAPDRPDAGLNAALAHGASVLRAADASLPVAALSADLPALRPQDLQAALDAVPPAGRGFVPDAVGTGTTLLAARAPAELAPEYGTGSRALHLRSGAVELPAAAGLRRDVDTPEDLREALELGVGARTAAVAARLPGVPAPPPEADGRHRPADPFT